MEDRYQIVDNSSEERYDIIDSVTGSVVGSDYYSRARGQAAYRSESYRKKLALEAANKRLSRLELSNQRELEITPEGISKTDVGNYYSSKTGLSYSTLDEAIRAQNEFDRREGLEADVAKFEDRITEAGRLREELAENVSARRQGQLLSQLQRSILGTGGDAGMVEALTPQITEQSSRTLQDLIQGSQAQTQEQLAQFIPTEISASYNQDRLSDAMSQFLMNEETQRAQIQANLDSQPEWWESILGAGGSAAGQAAGAALVTQGIPYLASLVSDRRAKENISQVGELDNGLPVYVFNYKGDQTPQIGVMAQDVEKVNEDAVIEVDGVKMVNYKEAVQ